MVNDDQQPMLYKLSGKIQGKEDEEIRFSCCLYEKEVYSDILLYFRNVYQCVSAKKYLV